MTKKILFPVVVIAFIVTGILWRMIEKVDVEVLIGTWDSQYLYVEKHGVAGTDSTTVLEVNAQSYPEVLNLSTSRVIFREDGSYTELYLDPNRQPAYTQSGYWLVSGDTLITAIAQPLSQQAVYKYRFELLGPDSILFTNNRMDYDGDGSADDLFKGISTRVH